MGSSFVKNGDCGVPVSSEEAATIIKKFNASGLK